MSGRCLRGVWEVSERCLGSAGEMSGKCGGGVCEVSVRCLGDV